MNEFKENQRFKQWWLIAFSLLTFVGIIYSIYKQLYLKIPVGNIHTSDTELILSAFIILFVWIFIFSIKLCVLIDKEGVKYKMFPFHLKYRVILWNDIETINVRKYKPILEYGGWGFRGLSSNRALNISGNIGIQIVLKNNKKLLLGTLKDFEVNEVIKKYKTK